MTAPEQIFDVPRLNVIGSRLLAGRGAMMERLGRLESRVVADRLAKVDTGRPVFVCGLARSGTTILLELIARHPDMASQRYLDYPFVFTPYLWNRYLGFARRRATPPAERAHKDGLMVSPESPEAMEEPLWMRFFPRAHDPAIDNVLGAGTRNPAFESFYDAHMAKLLLVRGRRRYLAKGNYHVARIDYLARLYPGARFIVPVRDPVRHIASSMKQHRLFAEGQSQSADARLYLAQVGHFEFGLDRVPINVDPVRTPQIIGMWNDGDEVCGWSAYWSMIHDYLAGILEADPSLRERVMFVPYDRLCADPGGYTGRIAAFCGLEDASAMTEFAKTHIREQAYYKPNFSNDDLARIARATDAARKRVATLVS